MSSTVLIQLLGLSRVIGSVVGGEREDLLLEAMPQEHILKFTSERCTGVRLQEQDSSSANLSSGVEMVLTSGTSTTLSKKERR
jgi:hypothetical protein